MAKPSAPAVIRLRGVRHNNLKNLDLDLPLYRLIVVTGVSGSGKSSLAFDTLFAEGQRRYIETFSPYARQFFDRMDKPQVDRIDGIPPAIAIEQRNSVRTTRSTVGTMTELCDYLKLLWPHLAQLYCRQCGQAVHKDAPQMIWQTIQSASRSPKGRAEDEGRKDQGEVLITFDLRLSEKISVAESLALIARQGYQRILVSAEPLDLLRIEEAGSRLHAKPPAQLTVVQDRLRLTGENRARFIEACEHAYHFGKGKLTIHFPGSARPLRFSHGLHCAQCDLEYREPTAALFSYNHPVGACPACRGFGRIISIDYNLAIPDRSLTLDQGAIKPWQTGQSAESQVDLRRACAKAKIPMNVAFEKLSKNAQDFIVNGDSDYGKDAAHQWPQVWYGVKGYFRWLESKAYKMHVRVLLSRYRAYSPCPECGGKRFQPEALLYRVAIDHSRLTKPPPGSPSTRKPYVADPESRLTLADFYSLPIAGALGVIDGLAATHPFAAGDPIAVVLQEIRSRLGYLVEVGLGYLTLDRPTRTLSGGETERVSLTTCLGTRLVNTLFVLDEPSVGLHARDTARLVRILKDLRDAGNTVVVVEHEANVMRAADQILDLGPGSGGAGGRVVFQGSFKTMLRAPASLTGQYLSGAKSMEVCQRRPVGFTQAERRMTNEPASVLREAPFVIPQATFLKLTGASLHNLKNLSVELPLNRLVVITGVSGSGKTTLARDLFLPALQARLKRPPGSPAPSDSPDADSPRDTTPQSVSLEGYQGLGDAVLVDQSLLGRTPRSNPAVYIGAFEDIRALFAQTEMARQRGLNASSFSFNSSQGQCELCRGAGFEKIEMQFLSDVFIRCPACKGRRYRAHILDIKINRELPKGRWATPPMAEHQATAGPKGRFPHGGNPPSSSPTDPRANEKRRRAGGAPGWSIADVLEATVDEAIKFLATFSDSAYARRADRSLKLLQEVGLGYLRLGQPINTLSGGESQRLKLVRHLADFAQSANAVAKPTLFLFDEPTTGLHFDDVRVLLGVFQRLVDAGHSVIIIEHNLDVIQCADWVLDLGPEAGDLGGRIVAQGTPEAIAACEASHTGKALLDSVARRRPIRGRNHGDCR